ncbi:MAG: helix-turn-helix domain-containing protein [Gemmatimonadaceae bacterium]
MPPEKPRSEDWGAILEASLGERLRRAKRGAKKSNKEIAKVAGVHPVTVSEWFRGQRPRDDTLEKVADFLGVDRNWLINGQRPPELSNDFTPSTNLRKRLRPAPYARVYEHIEKMQRAGCSVDQIELAERTMIDSAFNQLNKRDVRDRTDEDMIMDIDSAWQWIKEVLSRSGVSGLE